MAPDGANAERNVDPEQGGESADSARRTKNGSDFFDLSSHLHKIKARVELHTEMERHRERSEATPEEVPDLRMCTDGVACSPCQPIAAV